MKLNVREYGLQEVTFSLRQVAAHFLTGCIRHISLITDDEVLAPSCVLGGCRFRFSIGISFVLNALLMVFLSPSRRMQGQCFEVGCGTQETRKFFFSSSVAEKMNWFQGL